MKNMFRMALVSSTLLAGSLILATAASAQAPGQGGFPGGGFPGGGQMPQMPQGGFPGGGFPGGGQMPQMPQGGFPGGGFPGGGQMPQMPQGGFPGGGQMPPMGGGMGGFPGMGGGQQQAQQPAKPDKGSQLPKGYNADGPTYVKIDLCKADKKCPVCVHWDAAKKEWKDIEPVKKTGGGGGMFGMMGGFGGGGSLLKAGVKQVGDLAFAKDGTKSQTMDAYLPEVPAGKKVPAIIYIHGGAWMGGSARGCNAGFFDRLTKAGYAIFSINYRLAGEAAFPRAMNDAKAAVRYVRAHAAEYNIDADHIGAIGDSAGGNMVGMLGTTSNIKGLMMGDIGDNSQYSSGVQAVVDLFGPMNFLTMDKQAEEAGGGMMSHDAEHSPESAYIGVGIRKDEVTAALADPGTYIHLLDPKTSPAFLIQHGTSDNLVPIGSSKEFAERLTKQIGKDKVIFESFDKAGHEDGRFFNEENSKRVIAFLDKWLKPAK